MTTGQAIGVQVIGTARQPLNQLRADLQAAITDAGFTLGSFSLDTPGILDTAWYWTGFPYHFVLRCSVAAWADDPIDTLAPIHDAVNGYATVLDVTAYDARTGQALAGQAPTSSGGLGDALTGLGRSLNDDLKLLIVGIVVVAVAVTYLKPTLTL